MQVPPWQVPAAQSALLPQVVRQLMLPSHMNGAQ